MGSVACQLGKHRGAKVVALAGSEEKVHWLETELGVDKALNYKSSTFVEDFKKAVGYLDVYFDNGMLLTPYHRYGCYIAYEFLVGGTVLDLCLTRLKKNARVVLCGAISDYSWCIYRLLWWIRAYISRPKAAGVTRIFEFNISNCPNPRVSGVRYQLELTLTV